jgi:uncharacterized membrane protein YkvA (DUF1232 family)
MYEHEPKDKSLSSQPFTQGDFSSLINWISYFAKRLGAGLIPKIFMVLALVMDPKAPRKDRGIVIAALFYLVLPTDLVPDVLPVVGLVDDASALVSAIGIVFCSLRVRHLRSGSMLALNLGLKFPPIPEQWHDDDKLVDLTDLGVFKMLKKAKG